MFTKRIQKTILFTFLWFVSFNIAYAGPDNIASLANVTASSSLSDEFESLNVIDGHIRILNKSEWVSNSKMTFWGHIDYPWIQLNWDSTRNINKVILYDRPTEESHLYQVGMAFYILFFYLIIFK